MPSVLMLTVTLHAQTKTGKTVTKTKTATTGAALKSNTDSVSYAFGISLGQYMKSQGIKTLNYSMLNKAIDQTIKDQPTLMNMDQANQIMGKLAETKAKKVAEVEKEKGREFLVKNKARKEVVETPSGLQYEILVKGTGPVPKKEDTVTAHYIGSLLSGKEFDNSYKRGEPLSIPVSGVIPGWTEALTMMPVGSKWKLYIPSSIGYGDYGAGQEIPGGSTLVFEVELLGIGSNKPKQ
ncbi:FKBP-type peptidyl-prolyl cis-trans isomerase [Segetibacter koreensis]|uniref:FKBP-type peptidyl-prolyl cis-trans isomerase n=1 Tax=Segetibacter koreensis TaxID=398037 RepID=UPI0003A5E7B2|nr:FKBP-type peptidyl-prolyl cis-trans isomerase [Segetibacter koreensis]